MFIKEYISTLKIVCIFSNLFDSEHVGSPIINQLTGVANWKKVVLIFLHLKWIGLAVIGKNHSKRLLLFNVAFLMKCKYWYIFYLQMTSKYFTTQIICKQEIYNWS